MASTFTLPNCETILIPQIKSISKIYAYTMDVNRGVIKKSRIISNLNKSRTL